MKGDSPKQTWAHSWVKFLQLPKKIRGRKRFLNWGKSCLSKFTSTHLQSQVETCILQFFLWTQKKKEKREKTCPRVSRGGQVSQDTKGGKSKSGGQNIERILALPWCLPNSFGATKGNHDTKQWNNQAHGPDCKRTGCHWCCSKWEVQSCHEGKVVGLLCKEGNQHQKGAAMATLSQGIHGDVAPRHRQGAYPFHLNFVKKHT